MNGFTMSSRTLSLTFYSKLDDVTPEQLKNSLQVRSYKNLGGLEPNKKRKKV